MMINGQDHIFVGIPGSCIPWEYGFESDEQLEDMIQQVVSQVNRTSEYVESNRLDARLADGSRVHVVLPPVSLDGQSRPFRKFPRIITMEMLKVESGSITQEAADFFKEAGPGRL